MAVHTLSKHMHAWYPEASTYMTWDLRHWVLLEDHVLLSHVVLFWDQTSWNANSPRTGTGIHVAEVLPLVPQAFSLKETHNGSHGS